MEKNFIIQFDSMEKMLVIQFHSMEKMLITSKQKPENCCESQAR